MISQFRASDSSSMRLARTFSATAVKMYYVYVYVAISLLQIYSEPFAV